MVAAASMVAGSLSMCVSTLLDLRGCAVHLLFQVADEAMRLHQRQSLGHLDMLLHPQSAFFLLYAQIVQGHVVERGHAADAVEDILAQ